MRVYAQVLGPPSVEVDGRRHDPPPSKRGALLYYLVWRDAWASRDEVGALLWGDRSDQVARTNLRRTLFQLRATPLGPAFDVERGRLRYRGDSDLARLRRAPRARRRGRAAIVRERVPRWLAASARAAGGRLDRADAKRPRRAARPGTRRPGRGVAASGAADAGPRVDDPLRAAAEGALDVLTQA